MKVLIKGEKYNLNTTPARMKSISSLSDKKRCNLIKDVSLSLMKLTEDKNCTQQSYQSIKQLCKILGEFVFFCSNK